MNFKEQMTEYIELINKQLEEYVPEKNNLQNSIYEAMRYSLLAGGKRIRPVLSLGVCDMLGGKIQEALPFACAIECIHTYSLIHDDLPCMDNDDLRRGRPTNHKVFGEATALLAGDSLLNLAFEIMSSAGIKSEKTVEIIRNVSNLSGTEGMIGGQVVDLLYEKSNDATQEVLEYIHKHKTGALILAATLIGAICGEATETEREKIVEFAQNLGLAFQIKDDILDFIGDEELLGKPVGSDEENNKTTFVTLMGLEKAKDALERTTMAAKAALDIFGERKSFLCDLSDFLLERNF